MVQNPLNKLTVKWRLIWFMLFMLFLLVLTGTGGLLTMKSYNTAFSSMYNEQILPLKELRQIDNLVNVEIEKAVANILISNNIHWEENIKIVESATLAINQKWAKLLSSQDKQKTTWLSPADSLIAKSGAILGDLTDFIKKKDVDSIDNLHDQKLATLATEYKNTIDALIENRMSTILSGFDTLQKRYSLSQMAFIISLILGAAVSFLAGFILLRDINMNFKRLKKTMDHVMQGDLTQRLEENSNDEFGVLIHGFNQMSDYIYDLVAKIQQSGIQVTSSITEIAATIRQQETSSNEHAATISEIAASTTEISATSANLMDAMKKVNSLTKNTAYAAGEGHSGLSNINQTMMKMEDATGSIVEKLSILSEKAGNIAGVVKTINKIADQTNLLSLNASIEAEKAGEYGAGFAVVATEIRRLADQTAMATLDIEQMVQEVQSAVSAGVMGIDKFADDVRTSVREIRGSGDQLAGVIEQVQVLMPQINTVNDGIEAQALGAEQISSATSQLSEAAQQTAESIAQTSSTISQLQDATETLREAISRFKVN
ncbi:MAG: methyl-accepting chemotaxis protein [Proteobacteria bacterium]|nr:methyl-accepting chemotaxis protein [Pseudomonadota bacterium]MBU1708796.1 methyl-accepting chemotaxis protein [Pseudomonadota bacterium]